MDEEFAVVKHEQYEPVVQTSFTDDPPPEHEEDLVPLHCTDMVPMEIDVESSDDDEYDDFYVPEPLPVLKTWRNDRACAIRRWRSLVSQYICPLSLKRHVRVQRGDVLKKQLRDVEALWRKDDEFNKAIEELIKHIQSRYYRAPEVILGLPYSHPMDLWSIGCCLYELYMGKIAFQGRSNNEMMKKFIEAKGPVPRKLLRRAAFRDNHYNHEGVFSVVEDDPVTRQAIRRLIRDAKPVKELSAVLAAHDKNLGEAERRKVSQLADLLDKIFAFDPEKRITVTHALTHPFIKEGIAAPLP